MSIGVYSCLRRLPIGCIQHITCKEKNREQQMLFMSQESAAVEDFNPQAICCTHLQDSKLRQLR